MTPVELVLDASAAAKFFIQESGSENVKALVLSGRRIIAPEVVVAELASVALKRVRRGDILPPVGRRMAISARTLFDELVPASELIEGAFALALEHGFSVYDALYVVLARGRDCPIVTADRGIVARAAGAQLGVDVRAP